jgi:SAM-dependent methyltransferase
VTFHVPADAYQRFMGRNSSLLAAEFLDLIDPRPGQRVLDVGCGPGVLTAPLAERVGAAAVTGVEPSESFVDAARGLLPDVDIRLAPAEELPFPDDTFDVTLAQLVVHFMTDPVGGLREMARVTRPGGLVAASVWDDAGDRSPLSPFWRAVRQTDPSAIGETQMAGVRDGHLVELFTSAGLHGAEQHVLTVRTAFSGFDEWWAPFELGVGPPGKFVAALSDAERADLRQRCADLLPSGRFELASSAWVAIGRA